jgi:arsenate reductase-like glutaredoxin family protein
MAIKLYGCPDCPSCKEAKDYMEKNKIPYQFKNVCENDSDAGELFDKNISEIPVVELDNGEVIKGFNEDEFNKRIKK